MNHYELFVKFGINSIFNSMITDNSWKMHSFAFLLSQKFIQLIIPNHFRNHHFHPLPAGNPAHLCVPSGAAKHSRQIVDLLCFLADLRLSGDSAPEHGLGLHSV
uniref:(northern house mosquito) hypothetical protein n=1 Tax=Culex pipiens TaxID=7175 RepID=A0A8D8K166_CULPI